jgi:integrase/recombinase XerD
MSLRYRMTPLFWFCKPTGLRAADLLPSTAGTVTLRLTVNGKRCDLSTGVRCTYKEWEATAQRLRGASERVRQANARLTQLLDTAQGHYYALERGGLPVTVDRLKHLMANGDQPADEPLLLAWDLWGEHQQARQAAGEITPYTAGLAALRRPHLVAWLKTIKRPGLLSRELTPAMVRAYRLWLLSPAVPSISSPGYANKVARLLSECCGCAVERGALAYHPCPKLKLPTVKSVAPLYLTPENIAQLIALTGLTKPMAKVRDGFLLQCYTGMAWADARLVRQEHASTPDRHGTRWLRLPRQKTGSMALVPLLPAAAALFEKYYPKPVPVCANQLYNAHLKILGERIGLSFPLTSHIGRKTFAMLAAELGVSLDVIGAMLGHVNLKHTHIYARIQEERIAREMREAGLL